MRLTKISTNAYVPNGTDNRNELEKNVADTNSAREKLIEESVRYYKDLAQKVYQTIFK